jgi:DNA-directed RNA polymerase subunit RPC12/RpoP
MGTARFETLMDFARRNVDVAIQCEGCRYRRSMPHEELEAVFGMGTRVVEVRRRLRCSKCGHKGAKLAPIPRLTP